MNQYHLRVNIGGEENIFLIESNSPDNALKEGIDWADGNYKSIEVFQGHPSGGILECKSEDSAPFKTLPTKIELTVADPKNAPDVDRPIPVLKPDPPKDSKPPSKKIEIKASPNSNAPNLKPPKPNQEEIKASSSTPSTSTPPKNESGKRNNQIIVGRILITISIFIILIAFFFETHRNGFHNIGLQQDRLMMMLFGCSLMVCGAILAKKLK